LGTGSTEGGENGIGEDEELGLAIKQKELILR
jgi:hypothetical protein